MNPQFPIYLQVITPSQTVFDGWVQVARFPGTLGRFAVLKNHAPLLSTLQEGVITYVGPQGDGKIAVKDGFVQVNKNKVYACISQ